MHAALGLFVVALFGAEPAPTAGAPLIQYRVKILEMDGLKWRESIYTRLQPIARQGSCSIWTANREVVKPLVEAANRVLISPQVMAETGTMASYAQKTIRKVATQVTRHADGPVDHALSVAYTTSHEELGEGWLLRMAGRKIDQGMLVKVAVEDSRVAAVHHVKLTEFVSKPDGKDGRVPLTPQLEVPEVVKSTLEGEWLIPTNGLLVASLGAHTVDDGQGKAIVRERLIMIEASQGPSRSSVNVLPAESRFFTYNAPTRPVALPAVEPVPENREVPVPIVPSRSLPLARAADGTPVPLPPLPESQVPPTLIPGTSEPCATPQMPPQSKPADKEKSAPSVEEKPQSNGEKPQPKTVDTESLKASFQLEPQSIDTDTSVPPVDGFKTSVRPYRIHLPVGPGIEIEIRAEVRPSKTP